MRCKEHFQGDRCKKEARHDSDVAMTPDPVHVGSFSAWTGTGEKQLKVMQSQAPILHRDRMLERFIENPAGFHVGDRKKLIGQLDRYIAYQRTNKDQPVEA